MIKGKVVLVPFPFDDLSSSKVRPAVCLTDRIPPFDHVVLAFISSQITSPPHPTDVILEPRDADSQLQACAFDPLSASIE
jgi:mRNA interferase MazF